MHIESCDTYAELTAEVEAVLKKLVDLVNAQREAFLHEQAAEFMRLDKQLENTLGEKERFIGALREHQKEHGCHR